MAIPNTQTTVNTQAPQTGLNKTYYDKKLLETAKTQFVYQNYGQKRPIPKNSGKKIEMRRWSLCDPNLAMAPLIEGETPNGLALAQDIVEAVVSQYGAYFTYSDLLNLTTFDEILNSGTERLGEMLGTVVEWITRNELATGNNVLWAGTATSRETIAATDKLTTVEVRRAVRELKKRKARMFTRNGKKHYIAIVSPDAVYDLQSDDAWMAANTYVNQEALYSGEIGRIFGMVFVESTEAPIVDSSLITTVASYAAGTFTLTVADAISPEALLYLNSGIAQLRINNAQTVSVASASGSNIVFSAAPGTAPTAGQSVRSLDGTLSGVEVHQTICLGEDSYGVIGIGEAGGIESIIKPVGSGDDPLNQRGTVGAKVNAYTAKILNEDWLLRIEHAVSA